MRSDDYLLRECCIFRTIVVDLRHMFTVIPMNLFEQAVIHIYNGKSVKKVYYDPPFGMDIASLVFYNFFACRKKTMGVIHTRQRWIVSPCYYSKWQLSLVLYYDTEYGPHKTCWIVSCLRLLCPLHQEKSFYQLKQNQISFATATDCRWPQNSVIVVHAMSSACVSRDTFSYSWLVRKDHVVLVKKGKWRNILQPLGGDSPIKIEKKKKKKKNE